MYVSVEAEAWSVRLPGAETQQGLGLVFYRDQRYLVVGLDLNRDAYGKRKWHYLLRPAAPLTGP